MVWIGIDPLVQGLGLLSISLIINSNNISLTDINIIDKLMHNTCLINTFFFVLNPPPHKDLGP